MPSFPEFDDGARFVGRVKVLWQCDIEQAADANRHIAVSAEIEVELECKSEGNDKCFQTIQGRQGGKAIIDSSSEGIGKDYFFEQAKGKDV